MTISDSEFLVQFERNTLDPKYFNHRGHLRLAWLYLRKYQLEEAIAKTTTGISSYALSLGATDKFQYTLTEAIIRIMAVRLESDQSDCLADFLSNNIDLVEDIPGVVGSYYSKEILESELAKTRYVEPDLKPIS